MPASMMSAPTGGRPKVIGSSIAIVASGPMPGSTPISVPTMAPTKHRKMFIGNGIVMFRNAIFRSTNWKTTPKPSARLLMRSMIGAPSEPWPELQRQIEPVWEQERTDQGEHRSPDQRLDPPDLLRGVSGDDKRQEACDHKTERTNRNGKDERCRRDEQRSARHRSRQREGERQDDGRSHRRHDDVGRYAGKKMADTAGVIGDRNQRDDKRRTADRAGERERLLGRTVGEEADQRDADTACQQAPGEQARRRPGTERKAAHAGQITRGPEGKKRKRDKHRAAEEVFRIAQRHQQHGN